MPTFDPARAVRIDFPRGAALASDDERVVLLPAAALTELTLEASPELRLTLGKAMGASLGARIASRLGGSDGASGSTLETFLNELAGEVAASGLGTLGLERWGRALVITVGNAAVDDDAFLAGLVGAALATATGKDTHAVQLSSTDGTAKLLVASRATAERVRGWIAGGETFGKIMEKLHANGGAS
jgi:hypothetical protein